MKLTPLQTSTEAWCSEERFASTGEHLMAYYSGRCLEQGRNSGAGEAPSAGAGGDHPFPPSRSVQNSGTGDFPGGPVVKNLPSNERTLVYWFDPWTGN